MTDRMIPFPQPPAAGSVTPPAIDLSTAKAGATQVAAGAAVGEVWKTASHATLPDEVLLVGV